MNYRLFTPALPHFTTIVHRATAAPVEFLINFTCMKGPW